MTNQPLLPGAGEQVGLFPATDTPFAQQRSPTAVQKTGVGAAKGRRVSTTSNHYSTR